MRSEVMLADGLDEAFVGLIRDWSGVIHAVYDQERVIDILIKDMSSEEAEEYMAHNITCAYVGKGTPFWLERMNMDQLKRNMALDEIARLDEETT